MKALRGVFLAALGPAALSLAAFAGAASAQTVPRAEYGSVRLAVSDVEGLDGTVEIGPGDVAWRATARPRHAVRILRETQPRLRPSSAPGVAAGTILFGYQLRTGMAFCPLFDLEEVNPRVQCYRDFNDDGVFDGGYLTNVRGPRMRLYFGQLRGLVPIPQTPFEEVEAAQGPALPVMVRFIRWRGEEAEFRMWIEGERMPDPVRCTPGAGVCAIQGLVLRAERRGDRIALTLVRAPAQDA